jgi:transglutaminase-like putative cysteine protease
MILRLKHRIQYRYSAPVFLEPHIVRLRPRSDAFRQVRNFSLRLEPQPAGLHEFLDAEGNLAACAWFAELMDALIIQSEFVLETSSVNPFGYLITDNGFSRLPVSCSGSEAAALALYRGKGEAEAVVRDFIAPIVEAAGKETIPFLFLLNKTIYEAFTVTHREEGAPMQPAAVLQSREGACRDLAVLFMACCRAVGIAARFVSGYHVGESEEDYELHAWAEVYLPGGGWQGYDPTLGLAVAEQHIPLAASHASAGAAPVSGTYRGTGVSAAMDFAIEMTWETGSEQYQRLD